MRSPWNAERHARRRCCAPLNQTRHSNTKSNQLSAKRLTYLFMLFSTHATESRDFRANRSLKTRPSVISRAVRTFRAVDNSVDKKVIEGRFILLRVGSGSGINRS